jgi:hypothetical protein
MAGDPIDGQILLLTAAKASVGPQQLPDLVDLVQADLGPRFETYVRRYETAFDDGDAAAFFIPDGPWGEVGDRLGFDRLETDAVRRAHHEQLTRRGRHDDRLDEFESALEIRDCVLIARG